MDQVDRARIQERPLGFVKLVTARRRLLGRLGGGELVGAQIVGPRAGELIQECALAMQTRCFAGRLTQTIHPYPAMSLAVQQAAAQLFPLGRPLARSASSEIRDASRERSTPQP
jgi:pyruvate/2-oxoglutarate dehydrogenase complex dihydrolipoamide dehydrogenase (E3) component